MNDVVRAANAEAVFLGGSASPRTMVALINVADGASNTSDIRVSKKLGMPVGGFAAFADYLITVSVSVAF